MGKTALKLLHEYHTVDGVLDNVQNISGKKLKENLIQNRDQALLSKKLATIVQNAPVDLNIEDCCFEIRYSRDLYAFFEELGFSSVIEKLGFQKEEGTKPNSGTGSKTVVDISTEEQLKDLANTLSNTEKIAILVGDEDITLADNGSKLYRINIDGSSTGNGLSYDQAIKGLEQILENEQIQKIVYNGKRLILDADKCGVRVKGLAFDAYIAAYLLDPTAHRYSLSRLMYSYAGVDTDAADAADLFKLSEKMGEQLDETQMLELYETIEHPLYIRFG